MKRIARWSLPSVTRRSLLSAWSALLVLWALNASALAATPVDVYQNMESGNNGDLLTSPIMNASSRPRGIKWSIAKTMWVSNKYARDLPGPVTVGGITYPSTGSTRTWMYNCNNAGDQASLDISGFGYSNITVACYYTTSPLPSSW